MIKKCHTNFIVSGEVRESFKPQFDEFVKDLNRKLSSFCVKGDICSVTFKFIVYEKEVISKDE